MGFFFFSQWAFISLCYCFFFKNILKYKVPIFNLKKVTAHKFVLFVVKMKMYSVDTFVKKGFLYIEIKKEVNQFEV